MDWIIIGIALFCVIKMIFALKCRICSPNCEECARKEKVFSKLKH